MKRFHVHLSVTSIPHSIEFYSKLFGVEPAVTKPDYAKWMLEDPRINFAISTGEGRLGLNHLGFQVDSDEELTELREQAARADIAAVEEIGAQCCYARSDKHWIGDPQGVAWEVFHTLGDIPVFGEHESQAQAAACCEPKQARSAATSKNACCA
jgi:catechol 2,3-dioxygenase-like lactoylglutathione lyase family enzyme